MLLVGCKEGDLPIIREGYRENSSTYKYSQEIQNTHISLLSKARVTRQLLSSLQSIKAVPKENPMKTECSVCGEPLVGRQPHIEIKTTGNIYHTCNLNNRGNSCYQEWLDAPKKETPVNDLCTMFQTNCG